MWEAIAHFLSPHEYIPHGHCYLWQTPLVWLHVVSDTLTAIAYYSIPLMLVYFVQKRKDVPFKGIFILFSVFILSCGTTHLLEVWTLWYPTYWLSGAIKAFTALISLYTALELAPLLPQALALPSPNQLKVLNKELERQMAERQAAEQAVRQLNAELEKQIVERTVALKEAKQAELELQEMNTKFAERVDELERHNQEMIRLGEMTDFLQACLSVAEAENALADLLKPLFSDCSGAVLMIRASHDLLEAVATWGNHLNTIIFFTPKECWALRRGSTHKGELTSPSLYCQHIHSETQQKTTLCVPMIAQGETLGLLYLNFQKPEQLTQGRQQLAETVSKQIAIALANLKLRETLQYQSFRDPLTGLFNRRYLEISLFRELHRAARSQQSVGILMLDIDYFKRFNDTYGHDAGDVILRELGIFIQQSIRSSDIACRYGGEELTIIMPDTSFEATKQLAERLREGIKRLRIFYGLQQLGPLTVSLGIACSPEHGQTQEQLFRAADEALYQAKKQGRDCIVYANFT